MSGRIKITRAGPLTTIQDAGRPAHRKSGINASGPMDRCAFEEAGSMLLHAGTAGIEFTLGGLGFKNVGSPVEAAFCGSAFNLSINDTPQQWPCQVRLAPDDEVSITPGPLGNYGYVRFGGEIDVPKILGSRATNLVAGLGGLSGRALESGDEIALSEVMSPKHNVQNQKPCATSEAPIRFIWGIHSENFSAEIRYAFTTQTFQVSAQIDRMGARLHDPSNVFKDARILSLVSDAVVAGDIQILGDGTPIVLLRDHQITGGYPRIGTVISADLDRFAQIRPHQDVRFEPVTLQRAHAAMMGKSV